MADFARAALPIAGVIIGNAILPGIGGFIGGVAGTLLATLLFPLAGPTTGAPLRDSQVSSTALGKPLPIGLGTYRFIGDKWLWLDEIKQFKDSVSTKNTAPEGKIIENFSSWAQTFCEGPGTIIKLSFDAKLVYDATGTTAPMIDESIKAGHLRLYDGTNDQLPDPAIETLLGLDIPGHRGMVYYVADTVQIDEYGRRPQGFAVVAFGTADKFPKVIIEEPAGEEDTFTGRAYWYEGFREFVAYSTGLDNLIRWDALTQEVLAVSEPGSATNLQVLFIDPLGNIWAARGSSKTLRKYDGETLALLDASTDVAQVLSVEWVVVVGNPLTIGQVIFMAGNGNKFSVFVDVPGLPKENDFVISDVLDFSPDTTTNNVSTRWGGRAVDGEGMGWMWLDEVTIANDGFLVRFNPNSRTADELVRLTGLKGSAGIGLGYDPLSNALYFDTPTGVGVFDLGTRTMRGEIATNFAESNTQAFNNPPTGSRIWIQTSLTNQREIDLRTMEIVRTITLGSDFGVSSFYNRPLYSPLQNAIITGRQPSTPHLVGWFFLDRVDGVTTTEQEVVEKAAVKLQLSTTTDVDATEGASFVWEGFSFLQQQSVSADLNESLIVAMMDARMHDWKVEVRAKGQGVTKILDDDHLGTVVLGSDPEERFTEDIIDSKTIPSRVLLSYARPDSDYDKGTTSGDGDVPVANIHGDVTFATNGALSDQVAADQAERLENMFKAQNIRYGLSLPHGDADIEGAEVVQWTDSGRTLTAFVDDVGFDEDQRVLVKGVKEETSIYTLTGTPSEPASTPGVIEVFAGTCFNVLDAPLMTSQTSGLGLTALAGPTGTQTWRGVAINKSTDGDTFTSFAAIQPANATQAGAATTALGVGPLRTFDETNTLTVALPNGTLSSIAKTALMQRNGTNGLPKNLVLIQADDGSWEALVFANATDNMDGTWTLDTFVRGIHNTGEAVAAGHSIGNRVYIPGTTAGVDNFVGISAGDIDTTQLFRGRALGGGDVGISRIVDIMGNSGRPYEARGISGTIDGSNNWDVDFTSQSIGAEVSNTFSDLLPGVSQLDFAAKIYNGVDVVRTLGLTGSSKITLTVNTKTGAQSLNYTSADQVTDFGSNQTSLDIEIWQIGDHAQIGPKRRVTLQG